MATKTRKLLMFVNKAMYIMSIAMMIASAMLSWTVQPAAAQTGSGSIWTLTTGCGPQQNLNHYSAGQHVWINFSDIAPGTYPWSITPPSAGSDPVASGSYTVDSSGAGCFDAYIIGANDAGVYKVNFAGKNDNYSVCGPGLIWDGKKCVAPGMSISKTVTSSGPYDSVGDLINYSIVISNTGEIDLTNVTLSDPNAVLGSCSATLPATLATKSSITCTASHSVTQADLDAGSYTNTATATSDQVGPVTDSATVTMTQTRTLSVDKVKTGPLSGLFAVGDVFNYTITVTNTGNVTLPGVTVSDSSAVVGACTPVNGSSLAPGAAMTCAASHTVTQTDINNGTYVNTATGTSGSLSDSDSVTVTLQKAPAMSIVKTETSTGPYNPGDTITFNIVLTNTGNITLHYVSITDANATLGSCSPTAPATLAPGATMTCSASHVVQQSDYDAGIYVNTAVGHSNETPAVQDSVTITFNRQYAMSFEKKLVLRGTPYAVGDTINMTMELQNVGYGTLTNVTVGDIAAVLGTCTPAQPVASLAPGATVTCPATHVVTQADIDAGAYYNTGWGDSDQTNPLSSTIHVGFTQTPGLSVAKVADAGTYGVGDSIPYTITATNTGNITLHNVTVSDSGDTIDSCNPAQGSNLAPAAAMVCTVQHVVTQADMDAGSYVNTATATSDKAGPVTDDETVTFTQSPNFSIVKSITSEGPYALGDTITYSIVLTNTGNVTLKNVDVTDLYADMGACSPTVPAATLAPEGTIVCSASHVVTQADLDNGRFLNTAKGTADGLAPKEDSETVAFTQGPALTLEKKEVTSGPYLLGDTITYSLELTNIGNVTLTGVTISDPAAVMGTCDPALPVASLAPLAKVTCSATHVVTAADLAAGMSFMNTATGDSNETDPETASVTVALAIKGCTDPKADNYNAQATIDDGTCKYPSNPTPTPVPTLPIPATGGTVLIPVTGADLSQTLPAAGAPRSLFLGGMSIFGVAMVLSGLRRKFHL